MASKLSPPHALPRFRPATLGPLAPIRCDDALRRRRVSRLAGVVVPLLLAGATFVGCGRTEVILDDGTVAEQMDWDVDAERDVVLDDQSVVHVELVAPAPNGTRASLMSLSDGVSLEQVIGSVCPDGSPVLELDATGDEPVLLVHMEDELRAAIWM